MLSLIALRLSLAASTLSLSFIFRAIFCSKSYFFLSSLLKDAYHSRNSSFAREVESAK